MQLRIRKLLYEMTDTVVERAAAVSAPASVAPETSCSGGTDDDVCPASLSEEGLFPSIHLYY